MLNYGSWGNVGLGSCEPLVKTRLSAKMLFALSRFICPHPCKAGQSHHLLKPFPLEHIAGILNNLPQAPELQNLRGASLTCFMPSPFETHKPAALVRRVSCVPDPG